MVAVPSLTAVTFPSATVTIDGLELFHVTVCSVASAGATVNVKVALSPWISVNDVGFRVTEETGIVFFWTVTAQVALFPPQLAVTVAFPSETAFTTPLLTEATDAFELLHDTVLSGASEGLTVALRVDDSPTTRVSDDWFKVTDVTVISGPFLLPSPQERASRSRMNKNGLFILCGLLFILRVLSITSPRYHTVNVIV